MNSCPDCGLVIPAAHERRGRPNACPYWYIRAEIQEELRWTAEDDRMARWLAKWDEPTVEWVLSLVRRSRLQAEEERRAAAAERPTGGAR